MQTFTADQVAKHNKADDCWIIVHGKVYDVTKFLEKHPGGKKVLQNVAGKDATAQFDNFHEPEILASTYKDLCIGTVGAPAAPKKVSGAIAKIKEQMFGDLVPYGDPNWYMGFNSPYYTEKHKIFRAAIRKYVEEEIMPHVAQWEEQKKIPSSVHKRAAQLGVLQCSMVNYPPVEYAGTDKLPGGLSYKDYDPFMSLIVRDEVGRCGAGGVNWALSGSLAIGLPPILEFGSEYLKKKVATQVLQGDKILSLAITEPYGGSDVANLRTSAKKTPCGKYYIVNGEKKWITNGAYADFFTVAVRTGDDGNGGISLLVLERGMPGLSTRRMDCMGVWCSGTAYVTMEDVKVPVENLLGEEGKGFTYVMHNFNHERWGVIIETVRYARVCYEESFKYAMKRKTFGKVLLDHPVIRAKLGNMAKATESCYAWLEQITYQLSKMSHKEQASLGGQIALLKVHATQTFDMCAREACQVFGGLGYTRGGQGEKIERLYRDVRAMVIGGGTEEILTDFAVRTAQRQYSKIISTSKL